MVIKLFADPSQNETNVYNYFVDKDQQLVVVQENTKKAVKG